jgi:hypothetical protein
MRGECGVICHRDLSRAIISLELETGSSFFVPVSVNHIRSGIYCITGNTESSVTHYVVSVSACLYEAST